MSQTPASASEPSNLQFVKTVLDKARQIKTPIQFTSFLLAIAFLIVVFRATPGTNVLVLIVLFLPFILLMLVFQEKVLKRIAGGGYFVMVIVSLLVIGALVLSAYTTKILVSYSADGVIRAPSSGLLDPNRKATIQEIRDENFRVESYYESYRLVAGYYHDALMRCFEPQGSEEGDYSIVLSLRNELNGLITRIFSTRRLTLDQIYGRNEDISDLVIKLQKTTLALDSTKYFADAVAIIYGSEGETYTLDQIVDLKGWKLSNVELLQVKSIRFSRIEADLIRALGRDIVVKPIGSITQQDVKSIRDALESLGYAGTSSANVSDAEIWNRYRQSLDKYYDKQQKAEPFYVLGFQGMQAQVPLYLVFYDSGLLDLRRFLLKYCPPKSTQILSDLMNEKISLFTLEDVDNLSQAMLEQKAPPDSALAHSNTVIFQIRDEMKTILGGSFEAQEVLQSPTVEDYFVRSLKLSLSKETKPEQRDAFLRVGALGITEGKYASGVQELLSYYHVYETDVLVGVLGK